MRLTEPLTVLKGVGDTMARKFAAIDLRNVADLIENYPRRYEDYSDVLRISELKPGSITIKAVIKQTSGRYVRRGMHITEAVASDESGSVRLVWFNQPYRVNAFKDGKEYFISGAFELKRQRFVITNPSVELVSDFPVNTARIIPVYRQTKGLTSRQIRGALKEVLTVIRELPETLPAWLLGENRLMPYDQAIEQIHFPSSRRELELARQRLGFEEVFQLSLAAMLNKQEIATERAPQVPFRATVARQFVASLPFTLTDAQRRTIWQIYNDMERLQPMNRLVEGDVGSGKTVVAAMAAVMVMHHGYQVALMAPTEILARQHAETMSELLNPLGYHDQVGLLVGSMSTTEKDKTREDIKSGKIRCIIGTQALLQDKVNLSRLELIIIDEQHRFGVEQRKTLMAKAGHMPHVLSLTATPIPRSLALVVYGELDVSIIDAKPAGRQDIITRVCSPNSREQLYAEIKKELVAGRQMFVVCPLISESDDSQEVSVEKVYELLSKKVFKQFRVGLLHGKMKSTEKNAVMQRFVNHEIDILVSTTVIEVGVDVPNANVMLIEGADRFGLAQIHQLRGRIGRGKDQGYCYLMMSDSAAPSRRLRAIERSNDGFRLAELDLELRGPGAIYGLQQHGQLDLRIANITDVKLTSSARSAAQKFIDKRENMLQYPKLSERINQLRAVTNLN